ncbi:MAG: MFS transporter [Deinococcales bacterium]
MHERTPPRMFLPIVAAAVFTVVLTDNVVNILLPLLSTTFNASVAHASWAITAYALTLAIGVPLYGRLGDFWGIRRVFTLTFPLYAAGSLVAALAPSLLVLIAGRVVQATGAAGIPAVATVAVAKMLPPGRRGPAFGIIASSVGVGAAAGPIVGGFVAQYLGWRVIFYGLAGLALVLLAAVRRGLPRETSERPRDFDLPGGLLIGTAAAFALMAVTNLQSYGAASPLTWGSLALALAGGGGFAWRIRTADAPFVPAALFRNRSYVTVLGLALVMMCAIFGMLVVVPLLLVQAGGNSSAIAGLVLTPGALVMALMSPRAGRLSDAWGPQPLILSGLAFAALGALAMSTFAGGSSLYVAGAAILAVDVGLGLLNAPTTNAAAGTLAQEQTGAGLGIFRSAFFLGAGAGPAVFGALVAAGPVTKTSALNPLYHQHAIAFSDTFLAIAAVAVLALVVAGVGLRPGAPGARRRSEQRDEVPSEDRGLGEAHPVERVRQRRGAPS